MFHQEAKTWKTSPLCRREKAGLLNFFKKIQCGLPGNSSEIAASQGTLECSSQDAGKDGSPATAHFQRSYRTHKCEAWHLATTSEITLKLPSEMC